jgi:SET domain-containing protein
MPQVSNSTRCVKNDKVFVAPSKVGGRGVYARKDILKNEVIEVCPLLVGKDNHAPVLADYKFWLPGKQVAVALGYGSLYNHDQDRPNAAWKIKQETQEMVIYATRDIAKGKEVFIHYGDDWFNNRGYVLNDPRKTKSARS